MNLNNQWKAPLLTALERYASQDITHFDVPGHKKRNSPEISAAFGDKLLCMDANSTPELDVPAHPSGVIAEAQALLADAYGADSAFFLVNGSTAGVQHMILASCSPGDKIILPRNVHKSAINAIILCGARPVFVEPEVDTSLGIANGVTYEGVKEAILENPDAKAVFLINPTYFGATPDISAITRLAHRAGMAVLADESHGAHFPFHPEFPETAMAAGADMATVSIHKTGGSLTQTSALLIRGTRFTAGEIQSIINLTQTTSMSYILMASVDLARRKLATRGRMIFNTLLRQVYEAKLALSKIPGIAVLTRNYVNGAGVHDYDETKIVVKVNGLGLTGFEAYSILKADYGIQPELAETYVVLAVASIGDDAETLLKLVDAFRDMSLRFYGKRKPFFADMKALAEKPQTVLLPRDAWYAQKKMVPLKKAEGKICGESLMIYPPGIPLCIPGERLSKAMLKHYAFYLSQNYVSLGGDDGKMIRVIED